MSSASLEKLLKELAEILQESTEKYREEIDSVNPTIVSLSDSNLKNSLKPIIDSIKTIKTSKSIESTIIQKFREGFLSGRVLRIPAFNPEDSINESVATYYASTNLFFVYKEGSFNAYQSIQRRIVKGSESINNYFNDPQIKDILFSNYSYIDKKTNKPVQVTRSNIETGHLYSGDMSVTPAIQKLNLVNKKVDEILSDINYTSSSTSKLGIINNLVSALNNLKTISLTSLGGIKKTHKKDVKLLFTGTSEIQIDKLGKFFAEKNLKIVLLVPEARNINSSKSRAERLAVSKLYSSKIGSYLKKVDVATLKASKSIKEVVEDHLVQTLLNGKGDGYKEKSKASYKKDIPSKSNKKTTKTTITSNVSIKSPKTTNKPAPIRNTSGQFTSLPKILAILQGSINEQVASNMGSPRLNYRKGRFANSVRINNVNKSDKGQWTITYSYMTYPYQTFEPGYAQGSQTRDPRALIRLSIRQLVAKEIGDKFRAVRLGGAGSLGRIK